MTKDVLLGPSLATAQNPLTNSCCFCSSSCHHHQQWLRFHHSAKAAVWAKPSTFEGPSSVLKMLKHDVLKNKGHTVKMVGLLKLGFYSLFPPLKWHTFHCSFDVLVCSLKWHRALTGYIHSIDLMSNVVKSAEHRQNRTGQRFLIWQKLQHVIKNTVEAPCRSAINDSTNS